ncbi:hypothetical protein, partial [Bradyrhizobium sp. NBAIM08]|uniref:hypothetical protein n=1 Tax=Bradyrhizobium sp. NBAIM08 TaxID=2793815 RepID=UPI001CD5FC1B
MTATLTTEQISYAFNTAILALNDRILTTEAGDERDALSRDTDILARVAIFVRDRARTFGDRVM